MAETATEAPNSLGLEFDKLKVEDTSKGEETEKKEEDENGKTAENEEKPKREKQKPYVREAAPTRDKMSEEALAERMARIREQNEKIKQRRIDVQADEAAFLKTQEQEKARVAHNKKIQDGVDHARQQNADRKMSKIENREWDSRKPQDGQWSRGGGARGRGAGRARGGPPRPTKSTSQPPVSPSTEDQPPDPPSQDKPAAE